MRVWTKVWIAVAAVCIAATIYEIPNAVRIWRLSYGTMRSARHTGSGKLNIPAVVMDKLVATDPEAGDMLKYLLKYSAENPTIEVLLPLVKKYPQNEFFLSQLAEELAMFGAVDTRAALIFVDNLLKLNGENAHYRYLRGWILLTAPNHPGREREALEQFELGHRLPQFYLPYSKYKERLDRLYERAAVLWERPWLYPFYTDLARHVFRSDRLRRRLDENTFRDLSGSVAKIGDRLIENAYDFETFLAGVVLLGHGEEIRLRDLDMPEAEAQQSRLRVARGRALLGTHRQSFGWQTDALFSVLLVIPLASQLLLLAFLFLFGIVFEFIPVLLHRPKPELWKYLRARILTDAGLVLVLVLVGVPALRDEGPLRIWRACLMFLAGMFTLFSALGLSETHYIYLAQLRRPRLWITAKCGPLWFKGAIFWTVGSLGFSMADSVINWPTYGVGLLGWSLLCVLIWVRAAYRTDTTAPKYRHAVVLLTYWAVVLMVLHIGGVFYPQISRMYADPLARYRPLPQATQETYNRVILGQGLGEAPLERGPHPDLPGHIQFAASEDLRAFIAKRRAAGEPISERQLLKLIRDCNRDLRPIFLAELADPNAYDVLIIRAEWGDRSVKDQLERIFQERLATFRQAKPEPRASDPSSLGELLELAGTLARLSDTPEAYERFSYLMEQVVAKTRSLGTGPSLGDPRYTDRVMRPFWESLGELPPAQATALIKSYLRQTQFVDLSADRGGAITQLADLLADADRELAQEVVAALAELPSPTESVDAPYRESQEQRTIRLTRHRDKNAPPCLDAIFAHLTAESIPLLLKHLDSSNDQLRAFVVWRVTSLGYKWSREQLAALQKDSYWKVRVNARFTHNANDLAPALDDQSAVVRVIAHLMVPAQAR